MAPDEPVNIDPMQENLLDSPLDFLIAEHARQRTVFVFIEQLARARALDQNLVAEVLRFLESDMVAHVIDEEEDLFRHCQTNAN